MSVIASVFCLQLLPMMGINASVPWCPCLQLHVLCTASLLVVPAPLQASCAPAPTHTAACCRCHVGSAETLCKPHVLTCRLLAVATGLQSSCPLSDRDAVSLLQCGQCAPRLPEFDQQPFWSPAGP